MLSFDIASLHTGAATVNGRLLATDPVWEDGDPRPADGVSVTGRLSATPAGQYYFRGRISGELATECRRCLTDVRAAIGEDVDFIYAEADAVGADDPDVYEVDDRAQEIDLRPAVREEWLLAAPAFALCREDCKGICTSCGTDRNTSSCECRQESADPRWAGLEALRERK
jgi:uncharacterized protein